MSRWQTIGPIVGQYLDSDRALSSPFRFGKGVSIGRPLLWPVDSTIHSTIGEMYGTAIQQAQLFFVAEYEARAMNEPDPTEPSRPIQNSALQRLRVANLACWLALPTALGFRCVVHQQETNGTYRWKGYETFLSPIPLEKYSANRLSRATLKRARRLFIQINALPKDSTVWYAGRTLFKALAESDPSLRLPMIWIAIEGLLGADDGREIRFRLAQRAALLLGEDRQDAQEIVQSVKKGYDARSKVVHGMRVSGNEDWEEILVGAEGILRGLLLKVLSRRKLVNTFNSKKRDTFLDELALRSKRIHSASR